MSPRVRFAWRMFAGLCLGLALIALALYSPLVGVRAPYSVYNPDAAGLSAFGISLYRAGDFAPGASLAESGAVDDSSFSTRATSELSWLVVVEPATQASVAESRWINTFVRNGGMLVVAARTPVVNSFLVDLTTTRIDAEHVRSFSYSSSPTDVNVRSLSDPAFGKATSLTLRDPSALNLSSDAETLGQTDPLSFTQSDLARGPDAQSTHAYAWAARERIGRGQLIILADPDILSNSGDDAAHAAVREAIVSTLRAQGTGTVDEAHHGGQKIGIVESRIRTVPIALRIALPVVGLLLFLAVPVLRRMPRIKRLARALALLAQDIEPEPAPSESLREQAVARHPDWDPVRLDKALELAGGQS